MNILKMIGNTPIIRLKKFKNIFLKLEGQNPGGSIKDRAALYMIEQAEKRGHLRRGKVILEATSGNMGIALAMIGAYRGYKVKIVMSKAMSEERKKVLKTLGAELILTSAGEGTRGAIKEANSLVEKNPELYWFADQFNNPDNALAYYETFAKELTKQVSPIDFFVAGMGTSGTIMGSAMRIKKESPRTKIIAVIPPEGYEIQGIQNPQKDFAGKIYDESLIDKYFYVSKEEAFKTVKEVAQQEGLFLGMSSGANIFAAINVGEGNVVTISPDRGDKYLSTDLFSK